MSGRDSAGAAAGPIRTMEDSQALARRIAGALPPGQLLLLSGPLGAGKTTLVAAIAEAMHSQAAVGSPTYTLVHEYPTPHGPLAHADLYRLPPEVDAGAAIGLDDLLDRARAVVVEWGERLLLSHPDAWLLELQRDGEARAYRWLRPAEGP